MNESIESGGTSGAGMVSRNASMSATLAMANRSLKNIDASITMLPNELRQFLDNASMYEQSRFMVENRHKQELEKFSMDQRTGQLYSDFLTILQSRTNDSEVFETVQDIIQMCTDTIDDIAKHYFNEKQMVPNFVWLINERNTWRLLYCLYKDRLLVQNQPDEDDIMMMVDGDLMTSEKSIVEHLYTHNANLREYQLIVDWLEQSTLEQYIPQVGYYTDRTISWENTLHQLQNINTITLFGSTKEVVKHLDPDAPYREKLSLHDLDVADQERLSKQILCELRQGRIQEAQSHCEHCGQPWRAAILEGWRLHYDPNYDAEETNKKLAVEGNVRRDLWKKYAWLVADKKDLDEYTRAYIGALCGHLESLLIPLNNSWSDLFWAYLKVQIDIRVESELRSNDSKSYIPMPEKYWSGKMTLEQIFDELSAHKNLSVRNTASSPITIIQKYLILDNIPEMMRYINTLMPSDGDSNNNNNNNNMEQKIDFQMLRFLTHIILFMRQIGRPHPEEIADRVIKTYVEYLYALKDPVLVAFYTAALRKPTQLIMYASFLEQIEETEERKNAIEEAYRHALDIDNILYYTVKMLRTKSNPNVHEQRPLMGTISDDDNRKIMAIEWLTFYPQHLGELLWETNALIRTFLGETKIECVRRTFKMIPSNAFEKLHDLYDGKHNVPHKEDCSMKELLCHQCYLGALDSYNSWTRLFHSKPKEPENIDGEANFTERIAFEHKQHTYQVDLERWECNLKVQTKATKEILYNVLYFPERGYLVDPELINAKDLSESDTEMWNNRGIQLEILRKLCIPEIVTLLHKVLHLAGEYGECLRLIDVLAKESNQLHGCFSKAKLSEVILKISESSLALMNERVDPWGMTIVS